MKESKYSKWCYIGLLLFCFPCFLLVKGFISEAIPIENITYSTILILISSYLIYFLIQYWRSLETKIIADTSGLEFRRPLRTIRLNWDDISECGRFRKIVPYHGGIWVYYIKTGNKKIVLGGEGMQRFDDLFQYIVYKAYKAEHVNI
jgi:hypothetical protein